MPADVIGARRVCRKDGGARSGGRRSPWYQRAVEVLLLVWKQPAAAPATKAAAASGVTAATGKGGGQKGGIRLWGAPEED